jgi:hypothetical protein
MHVFVEAKVVAVEGDGCLNIVDDVADTHTRHGRTSFVPPSSLIIEDQAAGGADGDGLNMSRRTSRSR